MGKHKVADLVSIDGTIQRLDTTVSKMGLDKIQFYVGGHVEHADGVDTGTELWCNEDGYGLGLPHNLTASRLTGHYVMGDAVVERWEG
jgi:hypothetical protein